MEDLYYFLRKCMEKHHYDERLGYRMMRAYDSVNKSWEKKNGITLQSVLLIRKNSGKITNSYYHSGKAWIPAKNVRKTFTFCRTDRRKKAVFAESVCVSDIAFGFLRFKGLDLTKKVKTYITYVGKGRVRTHGYAE